MTEEKPCWVRDGDNGGVLCDGCAFNVSGGREKRRNKRGTQSDGDGEHKGTVTRAVCCGVAVH